MSDGPPPPRLAEPVELHFQGDWGQANIHRICGWLVQEFGDRAPAGTRSAIWTGRGGFDAVAAVVNRTVDVAVLTPAAFASMARLGRGRFAGTPHQELRALGQVPQVDRLVFAVGAEFGVSTFAELRAARPPLRIATSPDDGVNTVGWAAQQVLAAHGVGRDEFASWGGRFLEDERPFACQDWLRDGLADAILHEALSTPGWQEAGHARPLAYLAMDQTVLGQFDRDLGWPSATVPPGFLPGLTNPLRTADFSDFVLLVHQDLPVDVAHLLAWCLGETREALERQYRHLPPERAGVTYPLDRQAIGRTSIPLHEGAARYFSALES